MKIIVCCVAVLFSSLVDCRTIKSSLTRNTRDAGSDNDVDDNRNSTIKIVGGSTAEQGKYPWTVRLEVYYPGVSNSHGVCGAALWDKKHVITAAHCFKDCNINRMTENIKVCIGDYDQTINDGEVCYWAERWWWHNYYQFCNNQNNKNDIAVIRMDREMRVPYTGPNNVGNTDFAWLPNNNWYNGYALLTGWGAQNPNSNGDPNFPNRMKVVELPLMTVQECQRYWQVDDTQVCAGGVDGQNSCRGDSGGPLVWPANGWYTLIGLSSYGPVTCASDGRPNVFTRVASFRSWIDNIVRNG